MSITSRIDNNLSAIFDTENDDIYKALICDADGTIPETISKPTDIDIGMMASQIEYLRLLSIDLLKQMYIDQASGEFLEYTLVEFFNKYQESGETETQWVQRTIAEVLRPKVSTAMIIQNTDQYSSQTPVIRKAQTISAYAGFSYCGIDIYNEEQSLLPDRTMSYDNQYYTFVLILYDVETENITTIKELIRNIIGAGITCILLFEDS